MFENAVRAIKKYGIESVHILGDLTDAKDHHSSRLVNRIVGEVFELARGVRQLVILKGNHDYVDEGDPFFSFLGMLPNVLYVSEPYRIKERLFIPHSRKESPFEVMEKMLGDSVRFCFMHHTINGALMSNGQRIEGEWGMWKDGVRYYSGDVHVPQRVGPLTYVGSPYPVHFGDEFKGRMLVVDDNEDISIPWEGPRRVVLEVKSVEDVARVLAKGVKELDQIKLRVPYMADAEEWAAIKSAAQQECDRRGVVLSSIEVQRPPVRRQLVGASTERAVHASGVDPDGVLTRYAKQQGVDPLVLDRGKDFLS